MKKSLIITFCLVLFVAVLIAIPNISTQKAYSDDEDLNKVIVRYLDSVVETGEPEMWGFDATDDLGKITIGNVIPLFYMVENYEIDPVSAQFFPVFCKENQRTGIILQNNEFVTTTGRSGYISTLINLYAEVSRSKSKVSDYSLLSKTINIYLCIK